MLFFLNFENQKFGDRRTYRCKLSPIPLFCAGVMSGGVVSASGSAPSEETVGSCGTMTLQGFSFGSAAEVLDDDA
ncbi:MAG: hypothetical protein EBY32_17650, partial [Proteobacteria bacterium]|nr:hypothetical protein [Pseudomonadota bacterium]